MEAAGATKIFQRLVEKPGVCYISYYGDGGEKCLSWSNCGKVRMHGALPKAVAKIRRFLKKIAWGRL